MSEKQGTPQHRTATSITGGNHGASDGRTAKAIALLNYAQALQEYLEEQMPGLWHGGSLDKPVHSLQGHLVALEAIGSVTSLLTAVGAGKAVDAREFETVLIQAKAAFAENGLVAGGELAPVNVYAGGESRGLEDCCWSVPRWSVGKLCEGMEDLLSVLAESGGTKYHD